MVYSICKNLDSGTIFFFFELVCMQRCFFKADDDGDTATLTVRT